MPSSNSKHPPLSAEETDAAAGGVVGATATSHTTVSPQKEDPHKLGPTSSTHPLSRREKRQVLNAKHAAPQFPRIQNPLQRAKAYIRAAGLQQQQQANKLNSLDAAELQLGRKLGAPDERTRHQTVLQLKAYLEARTESTAAGLSEWDLLKLCKCLWYCLYMADRVPVQQELAQQMASLVWCCAGTEEQDECAAATYLEMCGDDDDDEEEDDQDDEVFMEEIENTLDENMEPKESDEEGIRENETASSASDDSVDDEVKQAALLLEQENQDEDDEDYQNVGHCRGAHLAALFVRCWYRTIVREWTQMDKYRIDKFYTLLRDLLHVVYQYMARRHWNFGLIRLFNDALHEEVLSQTPNGVRYHMVDICVEELAKVAYQKDSAPVTEAIFLDIMEPFFALAQTGGTVGGEEQGGADDTVHRRVIDHVLKKFLFEYSVFRNTSNDNSNVDKPVLDQVHVGTVANFIFEVGGSDGVKNASYRKNLYETYKTYIKRIKKLGEDKDVDIEGHESDHDDDDDDEEGHLHDHAIEQDSDSDGKTGKNGVTSDGEEAREPPQIVPPAKKSKKQSDEGATVKAVSEPDRCEKSCCDKKRKRKKRKIQQLEQETGAGEPAGKSAVQEPNGKAPPEEEITISFAHQKAAKQKLKSHSKNQEGNGGSKQTTNVKNRRSHGNAEPHGGERKRVKFGSKNGARSWKASMKGLLTMESPVTDVKPEGSILRNKIVPSNKPKKTSYRKKAADYLF